MADIGLRARLDLSQFNLQVKQYVAGVEAINKANADMSGKTVVYMSRARNSLDRFGFSWRRVQEIVTGVFVIDVFRKISNALQDVVKEAVGAVGEFQQLQIRFEALAARDFARQFGGSVADAFGKVTEQSKQLLLWIRQIAVTTPFSVETISNAIAYGQAFGFNVEQSKRLALATGNFAAGMGLTNEHMERIIYNMGQMLASGRILGRELRDLANNFVPVNDVIQVMADRAGVSFGEMRQRMKEAKVSAGEFITVFVEMAEKDFPDAMERMSRTLRGVMQNIQDFIHTFIGLELLGPIGAKVAATLADALTRAFQPDVVRFFAAAGIALAKAFDIIANVLNTSLIPAIKTFFSSLGIGAPTALDVASAILHLAIAFKFLVKGISVAIQGVSKVLQFILKAFRDAFAPLIPQMGQFGFNAIRAFAEGMAKAVILIFQVLAAVARAITRLLKAASPPRLLPDLDWWGQRTMQSWLNGWLAADFSIFNDIAGIVSSFIRSLSGRIPETDIIPRILGTRAAIAQAVNEIRSTGEITSQALNRIWRAAGLTSRSIRAFIRALLESKRAAIVFDNVKKILQFDPHSLITFEIFGERIRNINDLMRVAQRLTGELGVAIRAYVQNLAEVQTIQARLVILQSRLNERTEFYDDLLRSLRSQLEEVTEVEDEEIRIREIQEALATGLLTAEEERRLQMELQAIQIQRNIRQTERQRDEEINGLEDTIDAEQERLRIVEESMERQGELAEHLAELQRQAAEDQLEAARALVEIQIENNQLMSQQLALLDKIAKAVGGLADEWENLDVEAFEGLETNIDDIISDMQDDLQTAIDTLTKDIAAQMQTVIDEFLKPFRELSGKLEPYITDIQTVITTGFNWIAGIIDRFINSPLVSDVSIFITGIIASISEKWAEKSPEIESAVNGFLDKFVGFISTFKEFILTEGPLILTEIGKFITGVLEALGIDPSKIADLGFSLLTTAIEEIGKAFTGFSNLIKDHGPAIKEAIASISDFVINEALPKLNEFVTWLRSDAAEDIKSFVADLVANAAKIAVAVGGFLVVVGVIKTIIGAFSLLSKISTGLKAFQGALALIGQIPAIIGALSSFGPILLGIIGIITTVATVVAAVVAGVIIGITLFRTNFMGFRDLLLGVFGAIKDTLAPVFGELKVAFSNLVESVKVLLIQLEPLKPVLALLAGIIVGIVMVAITLLGAVISGIASAIVTFVTTLIDNITRILQAFSIFVDGIKNFFSGIWDIIVGIFTGNLDLITQGWEKFKLGVVRIVQGLFASLIAFIRGGLEIVLKTVGSFIEGVITFFVNLWNRLVKKSIVPDMMRDILTAISTGLTNVLTAIGTWIVETLTQFGQFVLDTIAKFVELGTLLVGKIIEIKDDIITEVKKWWEVGQEMIAGIIKGLNNNLQKLLNFMIELAKKALQKVLDFFGISSESKVFTSVGENITLGIIKGLQKQEKNLLDTIDNMSDKIVRSFVGTITPRLEAQFGSTGLAPGSRGIVDNSSVTKSVMVTVNPTYTQVASPASIKFDVSAALAAAGIT